MQGLGTRLLAFQGSALSVFAVPLQEGGETSLPHSCWGGVAPGGMGIHRVFQRDDGAGEGGREGGKKGVSEGGREGGREGGKLVWTILSPPPPFRVYWTGLMTSW